MKSFAANLQSLGGIARLAQRFPKRYGGGRTTREAERAVDDILGVLDRALRSEFSAPDELGRPPDVFGRVREEGTT
jgi:hypothetical protein